MKKVKRFLLIFVMVLFAGGCGKEECECPSDLNTNINEQETVLINDYSELYKQTVQSVVMVRVQRKNDKSSVIATGSGVVVYENQNSAYIYTNAHVVKGVTTDYEVEVLFSDEKGNPSGNSEIVSKVYKDEYEDVGVLEISKSDKYKVAVIGNSNNLEKGDWIYTIGSPLDTFNYTTSGNVSSTNVAIPLDSSKTGVITTVYTIMFDAAINQGNSGGALFDSEGKLVGITTLKYDEVFGMYGALPINYFDKVGKYLISNYGKYPRPTLNLELLSIDEMGSRKQQYGISSYVNNGVYVKSSMEFGVDVGLIITEINGVTIRSTSDFGAELLKYKIGDTIVLKLINKEGLNTINVSVVLHV